MLIILLAAVFGTLLSIFATQNTLLVSLVFGGNMLPNIPIYLVVLSSFFVGLVLALILHLVNNVSSRLMIHEKNTTIHKLKEELAQALKQAHKLELENTKLKSKTGEFDEDSL